MNAASLEQLLSNIALVVALVILPAAYLWTRQQLNKQSIPHRPSFEIFVGFGSIGGWILYLALVGSGPLIILPVGMFQLFIALPVCLYCMFRITRRPSVTRFDRLARWLLATGFLFPFGFFIVAALLAPLFR